MRLVFEGDMPSTPFDALRAAAPCGQIPERLKILEVNKCDFKQLQPNYPHHQAYTSSQATPPHSIDRKIQDKPLEVSNTPALRCTFSKSAASAPFLSVPIKLADLLGTT
jgi:hypothetical protein